MKLIFFSVNYEYFFKWTYFLGDNENWSTGNSTSNYGSIPSFSKSCKITCSDCKHFEWCHCRPIEKRACFIGNHWKRSSRSWGKIFVKKLLNFFFKFQTLSFFFILGCQKISRRIRGQKDTPTTALHDSRKRESTSFFMFKRIFEKIRRPVVLV